MRDTRHIIPETTELTLPDIVPQSVRKEPLPHQAEALRDILPILRSPGTDVRAQGVMACGTGKTLVGLWASEELGPRTLLTEPSLALVAQNLREWRSNARGSTPDCLVVCSDQSVVTQNADDVLPDDIGARVTSSADEVAAFLRGADNRKLLVSTLHSTPIIAAAMALNGVPGFDCAVVDEAHRTATREESTFGLILNQEEIPSRTRLFLTATPRIYRELAGGNADIVSMSDERIYGPRAHTLSFRGAIERKLLCDYQVVVPLLSESDFQLLRTRREGNDVIQQTIAEIGFLRAAQEHGLSKVVTFHNSVLRATQFAETISEVADIAEFKKGLWAQSVNGAMPSRTREALLAMLKENPRETLSILSNCRCLTEGVDVPALDGIAFFDSRTSEIDLTQAIGRVMRRAPGKTTGTVVVPVVIREGDDPDKVLTSSAFKPLWQVLQALRSIDDAFEAKCSEAAASTGKGTGKGIVLLSGSSQLAEILGKRLQTRVVQVCGTIVGTPLTEEMVTNWARDHLLSKTVLKIATGKQLQRLTPERMVKLTAKLIGPIVDSQGREIGENWGAVKASIRSGHRGLPGGTTLTSVLVRHGLFKLALTDEIIVAWANAHVRRVGSRPTANSGPVLDADGAETGENWKEINATLSRGLRGLDGGSSLHLLLKKHGL